MVFVGGSTRGSGELASSVCPLVYSDCGNTACTTLSSTFEKTEIVQAKQRKSFHNINVVLRVAIKRACVSKVAAKARIHVRLPPTKQAATLQRNYGTYCAFNIERS